MPAPAFTAWSSQVARSEGLVEPNRSKSAKPVVKVRPAECPLGKARATPAPQRTATAARAR